MAPASDPASGSDSAKGRQQIAGQVFRKVKFPQRRRAVQRDGQDAKPRLRQGNIGDGGRIGGNLPQQTDASQIDFRRIVRCRWRRKRLLQPAGSRQKFENLPRGTSVIALVPFEFSKMNRYPPIQLRRKFAVGGPEKRPCKMCVLHGPGQSGIRPGRSISPKQGLLTIRPHWFRAIKAHPVFVADTRRKL